MLIVFSTATIILYVLVYHLCPKLHIAHSFTTVFRPPAPEYSRLFRRRYIRSLILYILVLPQALRMSKIAMWHNHRWQSCACDAADWLTTACCSRATDSALPCGMPRRHIPVPGIILVRRVSSLDTYLLYALLLCQVESIEKCVTHHYRRAKWQLSSYHTCNIQK